MTLSIEWCLTEFHVVNYNFQIFYIRILGSTFFTYFNTNVKNNNNISSFGKKFSFSQPQVPDKRTIALLVNASKNSSK